MTREIISFVVNRTGITRDQLRSKSRKAEIVNARQGAMWLLCYFSDKTLDQIGEMFGGRDHSTVIHSRDNVDDKHSLAMDKSFQWVKEFVPSYSSRQAQQEPVRHKHDYRMVMEEYEALEVCG